MISFIFHLFISTLLLSFILIITKSIYEDIDEINNPKDDIEVDLLSIEIINEWFDKNDYLKKDNPNLIYALVIEESKKDSTINKKVIIQSFFDTSTRKISKYRAITYLEVNDELRKMFDGKDYIFFE